MFLSGAKTGVVVATLHMAWGIDEMLGTFFKVRQSLNDTDTFRMFLHATSEKANFLRKSKALVSSSWMNVSLCLCFKTSLCVKPFI